MCSAVFVLVRVKVVVNHLLDQLPDLVAKRQFCGSQSSTLTSWRPHQVV